MSQSLSSFVGQHRYFYYKFSRWVTILSANFDCTGCDCPTNQMGSEQSLSDFRSCHDEWVMEGAIKIDALWQKKNFSFLRTGKMGLKMCHLFCVVIEYNIVGILLVFQWSDLNVSFQCFESNVVRLFQDDSNDSS